MPTVVTNMLDAKAELDGRLRGVITEFVNSFAGRMTKALGGKDPHIFTIDVRATLEKDVPFLRGKLEEYIADPRTKETLVAAVMDRIVTVYEEWYEEYSKGGNKGSRKGKGREDEVWGPEAFGEWAAGVFNVGRLGFVGDAGEDEEGMSRRGSVGSM